MEQSLTTNVEKHRSLWVAAAATQHSRTPHDIRALAPDIYAWLYRNDREWLLSRTRELPSGRLGNHSRVDWAKRDEDLLIRSIAPSANWVELAEMVRSAVERFFSPVPRWPEPLKKYGRYPRTRAFVKIDSPYLAVSRSTTMFHGVIKIDHPPLLPPAHLRFAPWRELNANS
ncbi:hypothetical protein D0N73_30995 [Pseudomonas fluorescens]|nr:hypothetical protein D0N73_30995 [Pseudomonas fluorescens]